MRMGYAVRSDLCISSYTHILSRVPQAVTVGFFDDIYVPLVYLPEPSAL